MNNRVNVLVVCLGIATVAVATLVVRLWPELGRQRDANDELLARVTALENSPGAAGASSAPADSSAEQAAGIPAAAAAAAPQKSAQDSPKPPIAGMLEAMQGPQGQDFTRSMLRAAMAQMYPDIGTELDLTAEESGKLFDLLVKQQTDLSAESMALMIGGEKDPAAMQEMQRKMVDKQRAHEQELAAMLGSKHAKWEEYQSTAAARQQLVQLRATLSASGNALSEAQEKSLVAAFAREQARTTREEREWMASSAALSSPNMLQESLQRALDGQRRLVDVAAPILDAAQLSQFRRQVDQQASMMGAMMGMMGGQGATP